MTILPVVADEAVVGVEETVVCVVVLEELLVAGVVEPSDNRFDL